MKSKVIITKGDPKINEFKPSTILEQLFFTTVKIDVEFRDETNSSGTGFIFSRKVEEKTVNFIM